MASASVFRRLVRSLLALGALALWWAPAAAQDVIRFTHNVPGDSKPITLHADEVTTWTEGGRRLILLKGKVLIEHGVVQVRSRQAVIWIDQARSRQTGILRVDVYADGEVTLEHGPQTRSGAEALIELYTRGELKLKSQNGKVLQQPQPDDPLYRRAQEVRSPRSGQAGSGIIRQAAYQEALPARPEPLPVVQAAAAPQPAEASLPPLQIVAAQAPAAPPAAGVPLIVPQVPAPVAQPAPGAPSTSAAPPGSVPAPAPVIPPAPLLPGARPSQLPVPAPGPPAGGSRNGLNAPVREFSIVPRTAAGYDEQTVPLPNGETALVIMGGVILIIRTDNATGLVDIEADRLVFWSRDNPRELLSKLRTSQGKRSNALEFYLAGNVEIRSQNGPESRTLRADEVYYDVSRNVAVAMRADVEFHQPGLPDPVHLRAQELQQLGPNLFKGVKAEVFSSRLPSDPGLKVYVEEATVEEKNIPKRSIFGRPVIDRRTGQPETEHQRLFDGRSVFLEVENAPVFYLPFLRGDANDPLGPLESVGFGYNKIFGATFATTFNVYDLLGIDPLPGTRWRFDLDYLTQRGPAAGTTFEHSGNTFFGAPARVTGSVKAYGIYDTGTDDLGGGRGPLDHHPDPRGRFTWRENIQDLPTGFTVQGQVNALSDKNFLEQYFKNEFDTEITQSTFVYVKEQRDNWAWTFLTEQRIRDWVTETSWLPRADGVLLGQSLFDVFTYNAHASAGYARLQTTHLPPPPVEITQQNDNTGRFDLSQELSLPFSLGAFRIVPYGVLDLTYYTQDLTGEDRGRFYGAGGVRGSIPFSRLYPGIKSELLNLDGIYHKIVLSGNYYVAHSDTPYSRLPQLDPLNDDATDQALRDIKPLEPAFNPAHGLFLKTSPLFDPPMFAIRRLVESRVDTLDTIEELQFDLRQRWQTKRGYPGNEHIVDWMTLDLGATFFPHPTRDNVGDNFNFFEYDWTWNVGDRTALVSSGWFDPHDQGARVFNIGAYLNRPDRTSFYLGYRQIDPLESRAVTGAVTYVFSPKYAITASATYDFGTNIETNSVSVTRMGSDLQVSVGFTYNSITNNFGATFEIVPNIVPPNKRLPGMAALGQGGLFGK